MSKTIPLRAWATSLTIGAFLLMSSTGVLMFFGWNFGLTTVVHEWFSWLFLLGAGGHIAANVLPLKNHLKTPWGRTSVAAFSIVLAASLFSWGRVSGTQLQGPIKQAFLEAPLTAIADVTRTEPHELLSRLKALGIAATDHETLRELSLRHGVGENILISIVLLPPE